MAIMFRLEAKIISRGGKHGRSAVAAAAYRSGTRLKDERLNQFFDYRTKENGTIETVMLAPEGAPQWCLSPSTLWNAVERQEVRKDAQLCREFILSLPRCLDLKAQTEVAIGWVKNELVSKGMVAQVSFHNPEGNPHVHVMTTLRRLEGDSFSKKKPREWNDKALLRTQRETWAQAENLALAKAGRTERVDHRSLAAQGIDREPEPKVGPAANALQQRGVVADPERVRAARRTRLLNELRPMMKAIRSVGEIAQRGMGANWLERSVTFATRVRQRAKAFAKGMWQSLVGPSRTERDTDGPSR